MSVDVGRRVGAAVPAADGSLLLATDEGFARLDGDDYTLVAPLGEDVDDWFLNDGKCDALGRFWAGTVGVRADGLAADGAGSLYCLEQGEVRRVLDGLSLANGLDWSPGGRTLYYVDSRSGGIDAFSFDLAGGTISDRRQVVDLGFPPEVGFVDGLCVDTDGGIWAAVWGTGEVRRYTPVGELDRTIAVPVSQPTSCVFAGDGLEVLVITSARRGLPPDELERQPHAGSVFCCRPGATGFPPNAYAAASA